MNIGEPIIDYVRATSNQQNLPKNIEQTGEILPHFFGYDAAEGVAISGVPCGVFMRRSSGTLLQWSGKELEVLRKAEITGGDILRILAEWRVSRIDFAVDVFGLDTESVLADWISRWRRGDCKTRAKQTRRSDICRDEKIGTTIYLGGRSSEKMLRCYNKAVESGFSEDEWLRLEMEIKGKPAHVAPGLVQRNGLQQTVRAYFESFLSMTGLYSTILKKLKFGKLEPIVRNRREDSRFFERVIMPYLDARIDTLHEKHIDWLQQYVNLRREK